MNIQNPIQNANKMYNIHVYSTCLQAYIHVYAENRIDIIYECMYTIHVGASNCALVFELRL